ncbi:MAG: hypothetical protein IJE19_04865 [Clostridia bacterium]|nr:hypothetical protein [Clostridia bacterium]
MKKIMKKLTAVMLAAMICLAAVPAFAADSEETVYWYYDDNDSWATSYTCIGEVAEGENTIEYGFENHIEDDYYIPEQYVYLTFEAEKSGYYLFKTDFASYNIDVPEKYGEDNKVYGYADCENAYDDDYDYMYYYLPAGENIIGLEWWTYYSEQYSFDIEYLGDAVNDIIYDESALEDLMEGTDIYVYSDEKSASLYNLDYEVVFSEKTVKFEEESLYCDIDPETGEYSLTFLDYSEKADITTIKPEDIVKNVEVVNPDECLAGIEYYDGSVDAVGMLSLEEIKVTFADGTVEIYEVDEDGQAVIELQNGRTYYAGVYYDDWYYWNYETDSYEWAMVTYFESKEYSASKLNTTEADFNSNMDRMMDNNKQWFDSATCDAENRINMALSSDTSFTKKLELLSAIPFLYTNALYQAFCNFVELAEYYEVL